MRLPRIDRYAIWRWIRGTLFALFFVISAAGLARAWTARGFVADRRAELGHLQAQLAEQQIRGEQLQSRLDAFKRRDAVRLQTIRAELGMLRDNERFYVFK